MLFCSVAKSLIGFKKENLIMLYDSLVKTLSANLDCLFRKFYAVTMWTPIIAYKLVEYLANIHSMLF